MIPTSKNMKGEYGKIRYSSWNFIQDILILSIIFSTALNKTSSFTSRDVDSAGSMFFISSSFFLLCGRKVQFFLFSEILVPGFLFSCNSNFLVILNKLLLEDSHNPDAYKKCNSHFMPSKSTHWKF